MSGAASPLCCKSRACRRSLPSLDTLLCRNLRLGLLLFTQRVFDVPIIGKFKLLHVMLWLAAVAFLGLWVATLLEALPASACSRLLGVWYMLPCTHT